MVKDREKAFPQDCGEKLFSCDYTKLTDLNHKQLVYHFLFRKRAARTVDALIMPEEGGTRTEKYVDLNNDWLPKADQNIAILLTYLNAKDVIQCFVQH
ncbi:hypothetical protein ACXO22_06750 [Lactobacillus delbrueckii subsp. bulgaricus]|nr:hypothetical protein [Lactobacillus delbrueckii subsp. bulgaricus]